MSWVKDRTKTEYNLGDFDDLDEDALIEELTEEDLAELNATIDPEVWNKLGEQVRRPAPRLTEQGGTHTRYRGDLLAQSTAFKMKHRDLGTSGFTGGTILSVWIVFWCCNQPICGSDFSLHVWPDG